MAVRLRRGAFDAGLLAVAAASVYALVLVLVRAHGAEQVSGGLLCALLLAALLAARRDPAAAFALLRRQPTATAIATGVLLGGGLALAGAGASLLFLPAVLLLATVATVVPLRALALACALAAAGQLCVLLRDDPTVAERRLVLVAALGVALIPLLLAAAAERVARRLTATGPAPAAAGPAAEPASAAAAPGPGSTPASEVRDAGSAAAGAALATGSAAAPAAEAALALGDAAAAEPAAPNAPASAVATLLTPRQREVVALTRAGLRHGEIAERLGVSVQQVRRLLRQARERTQTSTTRELTAWSIDAGLPPHRSETEPRLHDD